MFFSFQSLQKTNILVFLCKLQLASKIIFISDLKLLPIWTKSNFSAFLLDSRHFEFPISPTFFHCKLFQKVFNRWNWNKPLLKQFSIKKSLVQEVKEFLSRVGLIWNSKCLEFTKKAEKFGFVELLMLLTFCKKDYPCFLSLGISILASSMVNRAVVKAAQNDARIDSILAKIRSG